MFEGKVRAALKFLDEHAENAVLTPTEEVVEKLKELHPPPSEIQHNTLLNGPLEENSPVYFLSIDEGEIFKAENATNGSGGPSLFDAKQWKRILCSNQFKVEGKELRI